MHTQCDSSPDDGLSPGGIAGLVLGIVGMLLVFALLAVCFLYVRKQQSVTPGPMAQVQQPKQGPYDLRPYNGVNPVYDGGINGVLVCICFILNALMG